jgi:hypothetical protein
VRFRFVVVMGLLVLPALTARAVDPQIVTVHATDAGFIGPERIPSGLTAFDFTNKGWKPHRMVLLRFGPGATRDSLDAISLDSPLPAGVESLGGSDILRAEGEGRTLIALEPGLHALLCDVVDEGQHDGTPWIQPLEVLRYNDAALPQGEPTIAVLASSIEAPDEIETGEYLIRVENRAESLRGLTVFRLRRGYTHAQGSAWLHGRKGNSPLIRVLGTAPLSKGRAVLVPANLIPGPYLLHATGADAPSTRPLRVARKP